MRRFAPLRASGEAADLLEKGGLQRLRCAVASGAEPRGVGPRSAASALVRICTASSFWAPARAAASSASEARGVGLQETRASSATVRRVTPWRITDET